jgi:O-antigen ligase
MFRGHEIFTSERTLLSFSIVFLLVVGMLHDIVRYVQFMDKYIYFLLFALPHLLLVFISLNEKVSNLSLTRFLIWAVFSFSLGITTLVSDYIMVRSWLFFMPLTLLVWFVLIPAIKFELEDVMFILKSIIIIGMIYCLANLAINYATIFSFWNTADAYKNNCQGVYFNKNYWGQALMPFVMSNVIVLLLDKKNRDLWWITLVILLYNIVASLSRAAILAVCIFFILIVFFIFIRSNTLNLKKIIIFFSCVSVILFSLSGSYQLQSLWHDYFFRSHDILTFRDTLWRIAGNYALGMPFWGYGFGSQLHLIEAYSVKLGAFHNTYIDWFMQGGSVHLLVNLAILGNSFLVSYRLYISNLRLGAVLLSALLAFCLYCNVEYVDLYSFSMPNILFCIIFLALPVLFLRITHENTR